MLQYSCLEDPWTEVRGGLQSMGLQWVQHSLASEHAHYSLTPGTVGSPAPQADGSLPPFGCPCCWSQVHVPMHSEARQTKYQSLERRKVYYKGQAKRIGSSCSEDPNNSVTLKKIFKKKFYLIFGHKALNVWSYFPPPGVKLLPSAVEVCSPLDGWASPSGKGF